MPAGSAYTRALGRPVEDEIVVRQHFVPQQASQWRHPRRRIGEIRVSRKYLCEPLRRVVVLQHQLPERLGVSRPSPLHLHGDRGIPVTQVVTSVAVLPIC